jgi:hypothetical protein
MTMTSKAYRLSRLRARFGITKRWLKMEYDMQRVARLESSHKEITQATSNRCINLLGMI